MVLQAVSDGGRHEQARMGHRMEFEHDVRALELLAQKYTGGPEWVERAHSFQKLAQRLAEPLALKLSDDSMFSASGSPQRQPPPAPASGPTAAPAAPQVRLLPCAVSGLHALSVRVEANARLRHNRSRRAAGLRVVTLC